MTDGQLSAKGVQNLTSLGNGATGLRIAICINLAFTAELDQSFHHPLIEPRDRKCFGHPETDMSRSGIKPQAPLVGNGCSTKELASQIIIGFGSSTPSIFTSMTSGTGT
jgi:hypothetical protein